MNLEQEKKIWKKGFEVIGGLDEAGRGPIAGPVTAAAVVVEKDWEIPEVLEQVKGSKQLSRRKREEIYQVLNASPQVEWATSRTSSTVIDRINILEATKLAMKRAVDNLNRRLKGSTDFLMIDGNFEIDTDLEQQSFIKGDQSIFLIAAASIVAKVSRDRSMKRYHRRFPKYRFDKHKGYPTEFHRQKVKELGACKIHRQTFKPVRNVVE